MICIGEDVIFDIYKSGTKIMNVTEYVSDTSYYRYHYADYLNIKCNSTDDLKVNNARLYGKIIPGEYCRLKPASDMQARCDISSQQSIVGIDLKYLNINNRYDKCIVNAYNCKNLNEVIFNDTNNYSFGHSVFRQTSISSIKLPPNSEFCDDSCFMFENCPELKYADIQNLKFPNRVGSYFAPFAKCSKLTTIKYPTIPANIGGNSTACNVSFLNCSSLKEIDITKLCYSTYSEVPPRFTGAFQGCTNLEFVDMSSIAKIYTTNPGVYSSIHPFAECTSLKKIKCTNQVRSDIMGITWKNTPGNWSNVEWEIVDWVSPI